MAKLGGRRIVAMAVITTMVGLWWWWPWLRPPVQAPFGSTADASTPDGPPNVITTFVEDPQRTIAAIDLWQQQPGSILVMQGRPSSQIESKTYLQQQGKWPLEANKIVTLTEGCDTMGQIASLYNWLKTFTEPGNLTVVTSPAHLGRTLTISKIVFESHGWYVQGVPVSTGDNRPESPLRELRDQLRAQIFRATGLELRSEILCQARDRGEYGL